MKLPDLAEVSAEALREIARQCGVPDAECRLLPQTGIINAVYALGDELILRVPRNHPSHIAQMEREIPAVYAARQAGVHTPRVVRYDDTRLLLSVPFAVYERVVGTTLAAVAAEPQGSAGAWREVGRDLARLHAIQFVRDSPIDLPPAGKVVDPRKRADELAQQGYISPGNARWITAWCDQLAPLALAPITHQFTHGDVQATNVMVDTGDVGYLALIDWGNAGWDDPAIDGVGMPLGAVPHMLEGHRQIAPFEGDDTAEARILWRHVQWSLLVMPREPDPLLADMERPMGTLLEVVSFLFDDPPAPWHELRPRRRTP